MKGKPLLQYTAESALKSKLLSRIVLSTDDDEVAAIGRKCGLDVPFLRPAELALDSTPMLPVAQHVVRLLEKQGDAFDAVCLLQPTNPLRKPEWIDACIEILRDQEADCVITTLAVPPEHNPHWVYFKGGDGLLRLSTGETNPIPRRQDLPPAFHREGSVYVTRRDVLINENTFFGHRVAGFCIEQAETVNIDQWEDWHRAEMLLAAPSGAT